MSNIYGTFVPEVFDQKELQKRISKAHSKHNPYVMLESYDFLDFITELRNFESAGFVLDAEFLPMVSPLMTGCQFMARFVKPAKLIKSELAEISAKVNVEYTTYLEAEARRSVDLMAIRLISEAEERDAKAIEADRADKLAAARIQAAEILGVSV